MGDRGAVVGEQAAEAPVTPQTGSSSSSGSKGGMLAKVFQGSHHKKALPGRKSSQDGLKEARGGSTLEQGNNIHNNNNNAIGARRGSKAGEQIVPVHNPDFFEADGDATSIEGTPRTQHLSLDDDDDDDVDESKGQQQASPSDSPTNIVTSEPAIAVGAGSSNNKRSRSPGPRSPKQPDSGTPEMSTSGGLRRSSFALTISNDFLHNLTTSTNNNSSSQDAGQVGVEGGVEEELILSASSLPPPASSPMPPSAHTSLSLEETSRAGGGGGGSQSPQPLSPIRSPGLTLIAPSNVASTGKSPAVGFFAMAATSPRGFVDIPPLPDGGAGGSHHHVTFHRDTQSSASPPPPGRDEVSPPPPPIREVGGMMATTLGAAGHTTAMLTTGMVDSERRVSMRIMAPLMRRYSQEIKTNTFAMTTTRIKEKKQIEAAVNRFNQKPLAGIDMLVGAGIIKRTPEDVAAFIRQKGSELSKKRVGELVGGLDPFCQEVLRLLLQEYDFTAMSLDQAMRVLIMDIRFPGESQMIDRIIERFSQRYYECNESAFATQDCVHILSFSLIMLNTDLHNRNLNPRKKMKLEDFIKNNRGINNGADLPRELLETLYMEIKSHELRMKEGDMYESDILTFMAPRLSGWLWKKSEGTFAQWKRHWFVLTGGCVYYFAAPQHPTPRCIIPLDSVTAAKGSSSTEIILYSNFGTVIKSVKIIEGRMVQGDHHRYVLRAADSAERDEWVEALQRETVVPLVEVDRLKATNASSASTGSVRSPRHQTSNVSSATSTVGGGSRSPRPSRIPGSTASGVGMSMVHDNLYRCIAEGWMRRRSDVSRSWQRRYFMLIVMEKKKDRRVTLHYFTTQEMAQRMIDMGVSTDQGSIPMSEVTAFRVKTPADVINYRPPDAKATVFEVEYDRFRELVSPEDDVSLQYWLDALRPVIHNVNA